MASNIYQMVTDRIIEQMNVGIVPWQQPWVGGAAMAISYTTRKAYSMLNQLLLGKPGEWLTWNQIQAKGGRVNPGAKSRFCNRLGIEHEKAFKNSAVLTSKVG